MRQLALISLLGLFVIGCTPFPTAQDQHYLDQGVSCEDAQSSCYSARPFFPKPDPQPAPPEMPELKWVYFDFDRSIAENISFTDFHDYLAYYPKKKVYLRGFTDPLGNESYNLKLAEARVRFVEQQMINFGVDPQRIVIEALGEAQPRHQLSMPEEQYEYDALISELAPDRRVEITLE